MRVKQNKVRLALFIIIPLLMFTIIAAVGSLKRTSNIIAQSQNEAIWYVLQLTKEYAEFNYQLRSYQSFRSDHNDMMLQYEILWSRFKTILINSDIIHLHNFNGALQEIIDHYGFIQSIEDDLINLPQTYNVKPVLDAVRADYDELVIFLNHKFRLSSGELAEQINAVAKMEMLIRYLLAVTLLLGVLIIYILHRESKLHHKLAMSDSLTGVSNRLWLNRELVKLTDNKTPFTFYLIDLDGFKQINDTLGHQAGDELLVEVASRLKTLKCSHFKVARMGGDEFAVIELCPQQADQQPCIGKQIIEAFKQPACYAGKYHAISASIGASEYPGTAKEISELLQQADFAMYEVKQQGKNGFQHFTKKARQRLDVLF
ncbi:GGDEF domain-containing protein [Photobacterium sanctipauli]|uniref:GGDEF domain-containing protein n=1 Tax=Photobacterium sanctipauli TaxID=1342794 RepID=A0A2T3NPX0_9GAMM|nr:GGDEF domain-containing protein [Photobacterium sanctipauli]PSW18325.1 GGDEF domain-containing protein [Photobacterium sanctipauli]